MEPGRGPAEVCREVFYLEDAPDLRFVFKKFVERRPNYRAFCLSSYREMIEARDRVLACAIAFLDIQLGADEPTGIDAFHWLQTENFSGKIFFLTGHGRSHPDVARALALQSALLLPKPIEAQILWHHLEASEAGAS